jgi:hypothetical protein
MRQRQRRKRAVRVVFCLSICLRSLFWIVVLGCSTYVVLLSRKQGIGNTGYSYSRQRGSINIEALDGTASSQGRETVAPLGPQDFSVYKKWAQWSDQPKGLAYLNPSTEYFSLGKLKSFKGDLNVPGTLEALLNVLPFLPIVLFSGSVCRCLGKGVCYLSLTLPPSIATTIWLLVEGEWLIVLSIHLGSRIQERDHPDLHNWIGHRNCPQFHLQPP